MLFNSLSFLIFFSLFFPSYWLLHKHIPLRNALILIVSYIFYGSWDWRFLSLIFLSTIVDYFCGLGMHTSTNAQRRKFYLLVSLVVNLVVLATFKYYGFFVDSMIDLFDAFGIEGNFTTLHIILPVGISFYTFQTLSYTIDIYKGQLTPTRNLLNFATFVAFFPQLVAGPIERAKVLLPQIESATKFRIIDLRDGSLLVLWGLFKKVIIADRLSIYVDAVFTSPESFGGAITVIAIIFFSIQIYCDFSGYSDIARGLAKMIGFNLMINFRTPYFSTSLKDFWQRWHISLSTWFRDYVYIPLGGSRLGHITTSKNIFSTFVLSGLWHGANYTFIIWGSVHALGHILAPFMQVSEFSNRFLNLTRTLLMWLFTMFFIQLAWVLFRSDSLSSASLMLGKIISPSQWEGVQYSLSKLSAGMDKTELGLSFALIIFLFSIDWFIGRDALEDAISRHHVVVRWLFTYLILAGFLMLAPPETGSFIYFQF